MKGLIIKDLCIMKVWKNYLFIMVVIILLLLYNGKGENLSFVLGYVTIMLSFLAVSTISYDEMDNGLSFLMTLPVSREKYVLEKYVMTFAVSFIGWLVTVIVCVVFRVFNGYKTAESMQELFITAIVLLGVLLFLETLMVPVQLKYGTDKGRVALMVLVFVIGLIVYLLYRGLEMAGIQLEALAESWLQQSWLPYGIAAVLLVLVFISYQISCHIMIKKEL